MNTGSDTHRPIARDRSSWPEILADDQFLYLGGINHENSDLWLEIERWIRLMWAYFKRFGPELYDRKTAPFSLKVRMLRAEVIETL